MYAIIATGGKQYKVKQDDILKVELLNEQIGATVKLDVLMLVGDDGNVVAGDAVKKAYATAEVVFHGKGPKIHIFTYKAKKNIRKRQGHRQPYSQIKITEIVQ